MRGHGIFAIRGRHVHQIQALLAGNPVYESRGEVALFELIKTET